MGFRFLSFSAAFRLFKKIKLSKSYLHQVMYSVNTGINKKGVFSPRTKKLRVELKITDETRSLRHVFFNVQKRKVKEQWIVFFCLFQCSKNL